MKSTQSGRKASIACVLGVVFGVQGLISRFGPTLGKGGPGPVKESKMGLKTHPHRGRDHDTI